MVYFQAKPYNYSPINFEGTVDRPLKALKDSFDVIVICEDADFAKVCDLYEPDIALFDCGDEAEDSKLNVHNTRSVGIPKIGLMKGDAWAPSRTRLIQEIEQWDLGAVFEQGDLALKENLPAFQDMIFYWPLFVDTSLYKDYQIHKAIPFLMIGNWKSKQYAWRSRIKQAIEPSMPTLVFSHPGYDKNQDLTFAVFREAYARTINASLFALGGGAFNKQFLKKNLEIPACRTCLVTDKTDATLAYGFADMVNCVFAEESDILDKLNYLGSNRDVLEEITDAGFALVHEHHSYKHRKQIRWWYELRKTLNAGHRIIQPELFGELQIVPSDSGKSSVLIHLRGEDRRLLAEGDIYFQSGDYHAAAARYQAAGDLTGYIPEADLGLALCKIHLGKPLAALNLMQKQLRLAQRYSLTEPDPIEWAVLLAALLCCGKLEASLRLAQFFPTLSHPTLTAMRLLMDALAEDRQRALHRGCLALHSTPTHRQSLHVLSARTEQEIHGMVSAMLRACGQRSLVHRLRSVNTRQNAPTASAIACIPDASVVQTKQPDELEMAIQLVKQIINAQPRWRRGLNKWCGSFMRGIVRVLEWLEGGITSLRQLLNQKAS